MADRADRTYDQDLLHYRLLQPPGLFVGRRCCQDGISSCYCLDGQNVVVYTHVYNAVVAYMSGRWQAPAAVLPPEGWQRGRGPEGHGHSRARRAREWPKHASPRARGRAKLSARLGACQCYYMFFTTQLKIAKFKGRSQDLNVG